MVKGVCKRIELRDPVAFMLGDVNAATDLVHKQGGGAPQCFIIPRGTNSVNV
jgi:hypothetical protein